MNRYVRTVAALMVGMAGMVWGLPLAAQVTVKGAGASFPAPVYARWARDYQQATGLEVRYAAVGSGAGIEAIRQRHVDFGATDVPLSPDELDRAGLIQFPAVIGGVVPVVNIGGIPSNALRLTGAVLGDIYLGRVRKWNDAAIAELNPGLKLPSSRITVVVRADASGTSHLWSEFLSRSNPLWKFRVGAGKTLNWPIGVPEMGNEGVASSVQRTRMSIGFVEYAYARQHGLSFASVRNRDGQFVRPGRQAFEAAALAMGGESAQSMVDAPGPTSWPIVGATYILVPRGPAEAPKTGEVLDFFGWAWKHGGPAAAELDYVPLPPALIPGN